MTSATGAARATSSAARMVGTMAGKEGTTKILPIFAKHKWGGGPPPKAVVEGFSTVAPLPLRQPLRGCHLPICTS
jgi:hypothetical protein